jgi:CheY-like chemotaxis protein
LICRVFLKAAGYLLSSTATRRGVSAMATILLVDDQPYMGEFLAGELADMGHSLKWISDGDSLVVELDQNHPDLVLLDLYVNGFEGWDLLDHIKRHDETIPVIILTAYDSFSEDPRLRRADGYLIKNFVTDTLKEKITQTLESKCSPNRKESAVKWLRSFPISRFTVHGPAREGGKMDNTIKVVLMADDDEDDTFLVRRAFAEASISVELRSVPDGEELTNYLFRRHRYTDSELFPLPDLILLDLNMPKKRGQEALAEIKADPMLGKIPVVVYTTSSNEMDIRKCYELGADSYVTKPGKFDDLVDALKTTAGCWLETLERSCYDPFG